MNKYLKIIPPVLLLVIAFFMIAFPVTPDREFSENENRYLAQMPKLSFNDVKSGKWMEDFEDYACDQFVLRDRLIGLKTLFEKATFHTQINGIYLADDDYFIEPYKQPENTEMIITKINNFTKNVNCKVSLMLVPTAVTVYEDKLPKSAVTCNQMDTLNEIYDNVKCDTIDVASLLKQHSSEDGLYYHLDHHWTLKGAYYGYQAYADYAGITPKDMSSYNYKEVTDSFKGTIYSKINDYTRKGDTMLSFEPESKNITVTYPDGKVTDTLYEDSYLSEKDKYSYYIGNDSNSLITINNPDGVNDETLVVIKDSYANSILPYLVDYYKTIQVINPRYFRMQRISEYVNLSGADSVLILYNLNTIDTDDGMRAIF